MRFPLLRITCYEIAAFLLFIAVLLLSGVEYLARQDMNTDTLPVTPGFAARLDWMQEGAFRPERYRGEARRQYEDEQRRIEQQWDNQSN